MRKKLSTAIFGTLFVLVWVFAISTSSSFAANNANLTQVINGGTLTTDIRDASRVSVANPSFAMSPTSFSFNCHPITGTLGSDSQRIYVDNPQAANNGWTLTLAATSGATATWSNAGTTQTFDYNDATGAGCTDGADPDNKGGQMAIDAAAGVLTADCTSCTVTNITKGVSAAYNQGTVDSVTLLNAAAASDDMGRWYLTGIGVNQTLPAEQAVDTYSINMTLTATAS